MFWIASFLGTLAIMMFGEVESYPSGAPDMACADFKPIHAGTLAQTSDAPYNFSPDGSNVHSGQPIQVTIESPDGEGFKGFLMVAVDSGTNEKIGQFSTAVKDNLFQNNPCKSDLNSSVVASITHINRDVKQSVTANWTAPTEFTGTVCFKGTAVKSYTEWWLIEGSCLTVTAHSDGAGTVTVAGIDDSDLGDEDTDTNVDQVKSRSSKGAVVSAFVMLLSAVPVIFKLANI